MEELSKQERKALAKEQEESNRIMQNRKAKIKKFVVWTLVFGFLATIIYWAYSYFARPLPGQLFPDLGREHVNDISNIEYNSNPPTSGTHFPVWAKKGVYDRVISDGYLIHSLEHGYIVISYDCTKNLTTNYQLLTTIYAQETVDKPVDNQDQKNQDEKESKPLTRMTVFPTNTMSWITPDSAPGIEVELPEEFNSDSCKALVSGLSEFISDWDRALIVPRPGMDYPIALTAWRRLLTLNKIEEGKMKEFIKTFHNMGPEKTME